MGWGQIRRSHMCQLNKTKRNFHLTWQILSLFGDLKLKFMSVYVFPFFSFWEWLGRFKLSFDSLYSLSRKFICENVKVRNHTKMEASNFTSMSHNILLSIKFQSILDSYKIQVTKSLEFMKQTFNKKIAENIWLFA